MVIAMVNIKILSQLLTNPYQESICKDTCYHLPTQQYFKVYNDLYYQIRLTCFLSGKWHASTRQVNSSVMTGRICGTSRSSSARNTELSAETNGSGSFVSYKMQITLCTAENQGL